MEPEADLLERYDRMVQTQIELLEGIDRKAEMVMRLCAIMLGLLLTGTAVVVEFDRSLTGSTLGGMLTGAGLLSLLMSLLFGVMTSVSSDVLHGPHEGLGRVLTNYEVSGPNYAVCLLDGYGRAVHYNRRVIHRNAVRLARSLRALLYGMLGLSAGIVLLFVPLPVLAQFVIAGLCVLTALGSGRVLTGETHLDSRGNNEI